MLGYAALILILAEGGLTTSWHSMRPGVGAALSLSTVGVVVSVAVVAVAGRVLLRWDWPTALLVGAVLASTDAAAVFSVLRSVPLKPSLRGILEAESGFNDAPVVILVVTISHQIASPEPSEPWWQLLALVVVELVLGGLVGLAVGWVGARLVEWAATSGALFAIGVLTVCVLAYAAAASIGASGFLATYACAVVLGNSGLPNRAAVLSFATSVGSLAQIGLFVLIGLLASPARLGQQVIPALVVGAVLLLVARPLSVIVSLGPFRLPWRHQVFLSWAGLRGAVPIVLATVPVTSAAERGTGCSTWCWSSSSSSPSSRARPCPPPPACSRSPTPFMRGRSSSKPWRWRRSAPRCSRSALPGAPGSPDWRSSSCASPGAASWPCSCGTASGRSRPGSPGSGPGTRCSSSPPPRSVGRSRPGWPP